MARPFKKPLLLNKVVVEETKTPTKEEIKAEKKKKRENFLPDEYKEEFEPIDLVVDETRKIVLSVKRGGEFGLPMCDVRQFQTTELYTGFTKKGINFPIELLPDLIELLQVVYGECEERGLYER